MEHAGKTTPPFSLIDLETAGHVFGLIERVRREEWQRLKGHVGRRGAELGVGLIKGIRARLETAAPVRSEPERPGFALVNVFDPQLRAYDKRRYGRLVRKTGAAGRSGPASAGGRSPHRERAHYIKQPTGPDHL